MPLDGQIADFVKPAETRSLYERAIHELYHHGWATNDRLNPDAVTSGGVCIMLACQYAEPCDWDKVARDLGFVSQQAAFAWNDAPGRRVSEVIARLRAADLAERGKR